MTLEEEIVELKNKVDELIQLAKQSSQAILLLGDLMENHKKQLDCWLTTLQQKERRY